MSEFTQVRLARASRIWIHDAGLSSIIVALARKLAVISNYRWRAVKSQPCPA